MKIDTLGLQAFVAIAEQAGFQKAADTLYITQTALTRRLQNLEALLGVKLIERTTRSVAMTQLGSDFLPQARRLLSDLENALTEIHKTGSAQRGDVSIACVPTVGVQYLPRIIQEYAARYPQNRIKILDHASSGVANAVLRREAEFGINIGGAHHPELTSVPLLQDRFVVICRDDHPLAKRRTVSWRQLAGYPLIFAGEVSGNRPLLDAALGNAERSAAVPLRGPAQLDRGRPRRARRGGRSGAESCDPEGRVSSDQGRRAQSAGCFAHTGPVDAQDRALIAGGAGVVRHGRQAGRNLKPQGGRPMVYGRGRRGYHRSH